MGRRESIAAPSGAEGAIALISQRQITTLELDIQSLMQEARALREEASALQQAPAAFGRPLDRMSLLHRQAGACFSEALELLRQMTRGKFA